MFRVFNTIHTLRLFLEAVAVYKPSPSGATRCRANKPAACVAPGTMAEVGPPTEVIPPSTDSGTRTTSTGGDMDSPTLIGRLNFA